MTHETQFLKEFDRLFLPAQAAVAEIAGASLTARQRHAVDSVLHAVCDEAASPSVRSPRRR